MFSKKSTEGWIMIDHSACEGVSYDIAQQTGSMPVGSGMKFESATITCSHCQKVVILNPDRSRSRGYCPNCDHYVCDGCEQIRLTQGCKTYKQVMDEFEKSVIKQQSIIV